MDPLEDIVHTDRNMAFLFVYLYFFHFYLPQTVYLADGRWLSELALKGTYLLRVSVC